MNQTKTQTQERIHIHPLLTPKERLLIWEKVRGIWKNRKPDPMQELKKMRKEWDRKLPLSS